jgi:hypothetical protein
VNVQEKTDIFVISGRSAMLQGMANVWRAEANDPRIGGVIVEWPSGVRKTASWRSLEPIYPVIDAAKEYVAQLVQERLDAHCADDVERTNIASLVAAVCKHIEDWNARLMWRMPSDATPAQ